MRFSRRKRLVSGERQSVSAGQDSGGSGGDGQSAQPRQRPVSGQRRVCAAAGPMPKRQAFGPGQVFNGTQGQQVLVLPSADHHLMEVNVT
ncbi:hypothetical protein G5714_012177 [Onychostoma macrolepis]|uniref:Uncharacterized protein n=1 Tax=Onychostoma macrolepis TaxID=369639 RepID=A0A7J6CMT6_9TELE|nr:hypothetical protein G5714_012177 [Onychostoma macrolepis]